MTFRLLVLRNGCIWSGLGKQRAVCENNVEYVKLRNSLLTFCFSRNLSSFKFREGSEYMVIVLCRFSIWVRFICVHPCSFCLWAITDQWWLDTFCVIQQWQPLSLQSERHRFSLLLHMLHTLLHFYSSVAFMPLCDPFFFPTFNPPTPAVWHRVKSSSTFFFCCR